MSVLIAIDPGSKGGVCILHDGELSVHKMPETERDICDLLEQAQRYSYGASFDGSAPAPLTRCFMEKVGGFIGGGGQPGSAMFSFGEGYGALKGILTALKIPFELVAPQKWQKELNLGSKGLERALLTPTMSAEQKKVELKRVSLINSRKKNEWKNHLKAVAQAMYPHVKVILDTSDCLLILEWARRRERAESAKPAQKELIAP